MGESRFHDILVNGGGINGCGVARDTARLLHLYGARSRAILDKARSHEDLGRHFGSDIYEAELRHLIDHGWAVTGDDILWRRTKRGLRLGTAEAAGVDALMRDQNSRPRQAAAE